MDLQSRTVPDPFLLLLLLLILFLPGVCDVGGLSPSLSAPGQAAEEPAEEGKQGGGVTEVEGAVTREGGRDGWRDVVGGGGVSPQGLQRQHSYQSLDGRRV